MYEINIGLEIHVELATKSKMFCSCLNDPDERHPNLNICPVCLGHPGALPVINKEAMRKTLKTGLALNSQISEYSKFDRKNYFYPDLPKGYQISQYDAPLCIRGYLEISSFEETFEDKSKNQKIPLIRAVKIKNTIQNSKFKKIRIRRVHLEEDTARLIHKKDYSLIDFNRSGIPLMELVTEPDIASAKEARKFAEELRLILKYLGVSDADMEKGEMRVEVNISLSPPKSQISNPKSQINLKYQASNSGELGTKVEIKNLNSFRAVEKALNYEIERQIKILESGKKIIQETRGWDENKGITISQREKEEAHDYHYFPEPDLPMINTKNSGIDLNEIQAEIPELPQQKRKKFKEEYRLEDKQTEVFVQNKIFGEYFEKVVSKFQKRPVDELKISLDKEGDFLKLTKLCANYLITDVQGLLKNGFPDKEKFSISLENFAEFVVLIHKGKISSKIAKMVLEEMLKTNDKPSRVIEKKGLTQVTDEVEIEKIVKEVISKNQKAVENYKAGKQNVFQFLIGQAMAISKGKTNPQIVSQMLEKLLKQNDEE